MEKDVRKVYVVGHRNPDTDSICSAIAYAALKHKMTGREYEARRAGQINEETAYVLKRFKVAVPRLLTNVKLQVKDLDIRPIEGIDEHLSVKDTWEKMGENNVKTMPIVKEGELLGIISTGDIAKSYMDVHDNHILAEARTPYKNILKVLDGVMVTGDENGKFTKGKVTIGASSTALMEEFIHKDDLVIVGNRYESQECAINIDVNCLVVCHNAQIPNELIKKAEEQSMVIIRTPYDTFTAVRLINQSIPVSYFMSKGQLVTFQMTDYVDDIKEIMLKNKFRDFPVLDRHGRLKGFISRRRFMNSSKKRVILVDHNEKSQAVEGIEQAEIVEIIDHHRLGNIETLGPVFFRNQPVGCTATIVSQMYEEAGVKMTKKIAGLLCSAIVSDTLLFRSPTCTALDEHTAQKLAEFAGIKLDRMARDMFNAGSSMKGKSAEEICFQDFKQFTVSGTTFGVGQISSMNREELQEIKGKLSDYLASVLERNNLDMVYFMLTDILDESTELLCRGIGSKAPIVDAFDIPENAEKVILRGVVSRKKQLIPALVAALQQ